MDNQDIKEQLAYIKDDLVDNGKRMASIENKLSLFNGIGICLIFCLGIIGYMAKILYEDLTIPIKMLQSSHVENNIEIKKNAWDIQQLTKKVEKLEK